jgi:hypothetical protein
MTTDAPRSKEGRCPVGVRSALDVPAIVLHGVEQQYAGGLGKRYLTQEGVERTQRAAGRCR